MIQPVNRRLEDDAIRLAGEWKALFANELRIAAQRLAQESGVVTVEHLRQALPTAAARTVEVAQAGSHQENVMDLLWTEEKNSRRVELIDLQIQGEISFEQAAELEGLTAMLRAQFDTEEFVPLENAKALHRRLLETKKGKESSK